jgi:hypothetical protein
MNMNALEALQGRRVTVRYGPPSFDRVRGTLADVTQFLEGDWIGVEDDDGHLNLIPKQHIWVVEIDPEPSIK